jgi:hypothetical protein
VDTIQNLPSSDDFYDRLNGWDDNFPLSDDFNGNFNSINDEKHIPSIEDVIKVKVMKIY